MDGEECFSPHFYISRYTSSNERTDKDATEATTDERIQTARGSSLAHMGTLLRVFLY